VESLCRVPHSIEAIRTGARHTSGRRRTTFRAAPERLQIGASPIGHANRRTHVPLALEPSDTLLTI
jgi:hypothetical protein